MVEIQYTALSPPIHCISQLFLASVVCDGLKRIGCSTVALSMHEPDGPRNLVFPLLHLSHHQQYPWVSDLGLRIKFKNHLGIFLLTLVGLRLRFH